MQETLRVLGPALLDFLSALIWPVIFIWLIRRFHAQIAQLLDRLTTAKVAGSEFVFQPPAPDPATAGLEAMEAAPIDDQGFFSDAGIRSVVEQSGHLPPGERAERTLLLFSTPQQRTWLAASPSKVAIVLDDAGTRARGRLVQRVMDVSAALPLSFGNRYGAGTVRFGPDALSWFYSYHLFPTSESLTSAVKRLISRNTG